MYGIKKAFMMVNSESFVSSRGFVHTEVAYNHPSFNIIPIKGSDIWYNAKLVSESPALDVDLSGFKANFPGKQLYSTLSGRHALHLFLNDIGLNMEDEVAIFTVTGNHYISSCVTKTIEQYCSWTREKITSSTKAILVNHEFGYAYSSNQFEKLTSYGLPIIEDCAYSMGLSFSDGSVVGSKGDYALFSLSKMFPMQLGGIALSKNELEVSMHKQDEIYVNTLATHYLPSLEDVLKERLTRIDRFFDILRDLGLSEHISRQPGDVPAVLLFEMEVNVDYSELKKVLWSMGVYCSKFYGREAFYLPCHQQSSRGYMEMIKDILEHFIHGKRN